MGPRPRWFQVPARSRRGLWQTCALRRIDERGARGPEDRPRYRAVRRAGWALSAGELMAVYGFPEPIASAWQTSIVERFHFMPRPDAESFRGAAHAGRDRRTPIRVQAEGRRSVRERRRAPQHGSAPRTTRPARGRPRGRGGSLSRRLTACQPTRYKGAGCSATACNTTRPVQKSGGAGTEGVSPSCRSRSAVLRAGRSCF